VEEPSLEPVLEPDVIDEELNVEPPALPPGAPRVTFRDIMAEPGIDRDALRAAAPPPTVASPAAAPPARPAAPLEPVAEVVERPTEPELSSPTLAELYFDQGFFEKAIEVYRHLLQREPGNERLRARMGEIEAVQRRSAMPTGAPGSRQEAIGRVIARLQDLRAALATRRY
jgi:hypothetical protein